MTEMSPFDVIADQLYSLAPSDFVAARDDRVAAARQSGDAATAKAIKNLRRPTQSAWLVNQLWRQEHRQVTKLLEMGNELRRAAQALKGDDMRRLSARRHELISGLLAAGRHVAEAAGIRLDAATSAEVEATLAAAVADSSVAADVESGRMVRAAEYSGFGPAVPVGAKPSRERRTTGEAKPIRTGRASRNRQSRQALEAAEADFDEARKRHETAVQQREEARRREEELLERRATLRSQVRELDGLLTGAKRAALRAEAQQRSAEKELAHAERRLTQATRGQPTADD